MGFKVDEGYYHKTGTTYGLAHRCGTVQAEEYHVKDFWATWVEAHFTAKATDAVGNQGAASAALDVTVNTSGTLAITGTSGDDMANVELIQSVYYTLSESRGAETERIVTVIAPKRNLAFPSEAGADA